MVHYSTSDRKINEYSLYILSKIVEEEVGEIDG